MLNSDLTSLIDSVLRPYQQVWIKVALAHSFIAHLGARQIGKDWVWSWFVVVTCVSIPGQQWQVVSKSKKHAQAFIRDCKAHLKFINKVLYSSGSRPIEIVSDSMETLHLSNGARVESHSSNPDAVQGMRGSFLLNEIGALKEAKEIFETGYPIVTGALDNGIPAWFIIVGNATRKGTFWHNFFTDGKRHKGFKRLKSTWRGCYETMGKSEEWLASRELARRINLGPNGYSQWYECNFRSSNDAFFSDELIRSCLYEDVDDRGNYIAPFDLLLPQSIGYDVGITNNPTVFSRVLVDDELEHFRNMYALPTVSLQGVKFKDQFKTLEDLTLERDTYAIIPDARGLGAKVAEDLEDLYPGLVEPFKGTMEKNYNIFSAVKDAMEKGELLIPASDEELLLELENVELDHTDSGMPRIMLPETNNPETGLKCHGDRAYALALAIHGTNFMTDTSVPHVKKTAPLYKHDIGSIYSHKGW